MDQRADQTSSDPPPATARHAVDLRCSLPLPRGRWYLTVVAGKERRPPERRTRDRRRHPLWTAGNVVVLAGAAFTGGLAALNLLLLVLAAVLSDGAPTLVVAR